MDIKQFAKEYTKKKQLYDKKTHRKSGVFQFPADGQVSEIAPRVPPKAGAAVIGTSELFQ
jgi:hypothetical protein